MTTTDVYQGMDSGTKPSSRVLNPPGGRSNISLFGDPEPPAPARPKQSGARQSGKAASGSPAQSAKPTSDTSSFSTLGFGDADSATDLAAQRAAYQKRNQASTFMFSGEDNSASASQPKARPQKKEPIPPTSVESHASNCNQVNPITNQTSSPAPANNESPSRVSLINDQKKRPAAGAPSNIAWEDSRPRQRSQPPGGKSSIIF